MERLAGSLQGPVLITRDTRLDGQIHGDVTVEPGAKLIVGSGRITRNVIALDGSTVIVYGRVNGAVVARGGHVEIYGTIGSLVDSNESPAIVSIDAIILDR